MMHLTVYNVQEYGVIKRILKKFSSGNQGVSGYNKVYGTMYITMYSTMSSTMYNVVYSTVCSIMVSTVYSCDSYREMVVPNYLSQLILSL